MKDDLNYTTQISYYTNQQFAVVTSQHRYNSQQTHHYWKIWFLSRRS